MGISVPSTIPSFYPYPWENRYLFLLASQKFAVGQSARLVGMRQWGAIGEIVGETEEATGYPVYSELVTPSWHFPDGNISWHLRRVALQKIYTANSFNAAELSYRTSDTPTLLYQNAPSQLGGYAPPYAGRPPGTVLIPEFGNFHDLRFPWKDDHAWESLDIEVEGPCAIELYASIAQTNPDTRPTIPTLTTTQIALLPPEEQFVAAFPNAVYTRIAGSLIFEEANFVPENYPKVDKDPNYSLYLPSTLAGKAAKRRATLKRGAAK